MEVNNYASRGLGGAALGTGVAGLSLGVLNAMGNGGLLGGLFNGGCNSGCGNGVAVNRYEMGLEKESLAKDSKIALLESTIHTNDKILEVYTNLDGRLRGIESQICQQAVINAQVTANISCMQTAISGLQAMTKTVIPITNICPQPSVATTTPTT